MARGENGAGVLYGAEGGIPLEIAASYRARARGLLGRDGIEGALLLTPASGVHTFRMRFAIDVAYLSRDLTVLAVRTMPPGRLGLPACAPGMSWRRRRGRWRGGACAPGCGWVWKSAADGGRWAAAGVKRCLHDKVVGSVVVRRRMRPAPAAAAPRS